MPSTYTTNTGIEKPGDGEQSGSWGDTVNDNMDILDRALNGVLSLSLAGTTTTLTTGSGSTSGTGTYGQYRVLVLGGSPSGTNTITVAPNDAQKLYFVVNNSGESAVFTQGSGGNVTIVDGDSAIIYCDGGGGSAAVVDVSALFVPNLGNAGVTASASELNVLDGITSTTAELNILDGVTADASEINVLDGITASTAELNILDGVTATTAELNYVAGVTSSIQTQINNIASFPSGGIVMWSGSVASIPSGWYLCDGANGTPDLRNRFVVGAGSTYAVAATGGTADAIVVAHTHTYSGTTNTTGAHTHTVPEIINTGGAASGFLGYDNELQTTATTTSSAGDHSHTFSGTTASSGSSGTNANLPPYYALAYIMKA